VRSAKNWRKFLNDSLLSDRARQSLTFYGLLTSWRCRTVEFTGHTTCRSMDRHSWSEWFFCTTCIAQNSQNIRCLLIDPQITIQQITLLVTTACTVSCMFTVSREKQHHSDSRLHGFCSWVQLRSSSAMYHWTVNNKIITLCLTNNKFQLNNNELLTLFFIFKLLQRNQW